MDLAPDIGYKKAATTAFWYLGRFKLNLLKLSRCYSVLGLAINPKRFNKLSNIVWCDMLLSSKAAIKKNMKRDSVQGRAVAKSYESVKTLSK